MTESTRRHDAIALAVLAAVITLLFLDVLAGFNVLYLRDVVHYYYPAKHLLREIVLGGEFPYWNPYFGAGQPLAANPEHEVFYPLTWLILLPNFRAAFHLLTLVHLYIGGFAMYALLRSMRMRAPAAFFGALAFATGGLAASNLNLQPILFAIVWMPLTCRYTRRFLTHRSWRDFALAALFFGLEVLVGEPSTILQTGLLLGMYALYRCVQDRSMRPLLMVALISVAAAAIGAVQLLPALDHASDSVRARGFTFDVVTLWSMPPARLGEFLNPGLFGSPLDEGPYWGSRLYPKRGAPFLYSIYPGLLLTILVIGGFFARVRGWGLALTVCAFSILMALGAHTPLWQLLYDLGLRSLRYPEKFIFMAVFTMIVFGARSLDALLGGDERVRRATLVAAGVITVLATIAAIVAHTPVYPPMFAALWQPGAKKFAVALAASAFGWLATAARAGVVLVLIRNATQHAAWLALAALFMTIDLGAVLFETVPRMPASYYDEPPALARHLPPQREQWRLFHHADWHKLRPAVQAYYEPHPDLSWVYRNALAPPIPAQYGVRMVLETDYDLTALTATADFARSVGELSDLRRDWINVTASMSNVWYRAVFRNPREALAEVGGDRRVLQPVGILAVGKYPRFYFADRVESIADRADFVRKLGSARFSRQTAFVHGASFTPATGRVLRASETANTARIEVETAGRAFLVVSITPHEYWRVLVDGKPAPAIVTNVGYQGVEIPGPGRHVVEMRYRNPLIAIGGAVSAAALLALSIVAITMRAL